jgi:hypothetical protein
MLGYQHTLMWRDMAHQTPSPDMIERLTTYRQAYALTTRHFVMAAQDIWDDDNKTLVMTWLTLKLGDFMFTLQ